MSRFEDTECCPCSTLSGNNSYSEDDTMKIMQKFKTFYERKLEEVDLDGGGDCLELKLKIQQRWIQDLTEQTEMMARIVKELEEEATRRVRLLEDKLEESSKLASEVMKRYQTYSMNHNLDDPFQRVFYLENDVKNLLEFVRRIRDDECWCIDGLQFYDVTYFDLFGKPQDVDKEFVECVPENNTDNPDKGRAQTDPNERTDSLPQLKEQLKKKDEEYEALKQSAIDMRFALTEEVACKHDMISALKKEVQQLEERCIQADKQTAFKDDIIKELRKEIKQLKQQHEDCEDKLKKLRNDRCSLQEKICCLEGELGKCQRILCGEDAGTMVDCCDLGLTSKEKELEDVVCKKQCELEGLQCRCSELESALSKSKNKIENLKKTKNKEWEEIVCKKDCEINELNYKCKNLETALTSSKDRAENLQKAGASKNEVKKLRQQVCCYQHVVDCFKHEMAVMSEQLVSLQDILNLSNQSCREESEQLYKAVIDLQSLSKRLNDELQETEKQVYVENQMNQVKDVRIEELKQIIEKKNLDLNAHDETIQDLKRRMDNLIIENHELQSTVVSLNSTVMQLQCTMQSRELEKTQQAESCRSHVIVCQRSMCDLKDTIHKQNKKIEKLQAECECQHEMSKSAERELEKSREKNKERIKQMKKQIDDLRQKLAETEMQSQHLYDELANVRKKAADLSQKECCRDHEVTQCKQIVIELRQTLIELNESLEEVVPVDTELSDDSAKRAVAFQGEENIFAGCRCEISIYKKLTENIKNMIIQSNKKLSDLECQNKKLRSEIDEKVSEIHQLQDRIGKREKEFCAYCCDLGEKLRKSQAEEKRLNDHINKIKNNLEKKLEDSTNEQEQINALKSEIKCMMQNQLALNSENDKLLTQVNQLQSIITPKEDRCRCLKEKLDKAIAETNSLREKVKMLTEEKEKLNVDLCCLQSGYDNLMKAHKSTRKVTKDLETELECMKNDRDEICDESRCVVSNVKAWLEEQRKINSEVKRKAHCYSSTVDKLRRENEALINQALTQISPQRLICTKTPHQSKPKKCCAGKCGTCPRPEVPYHSPWSLGSQGTGSGGSPRDSPSSFLSCSVEEWYAPNYRDDDETDYQDEEFVNKIEALTNEMKNNNKKFKLKCQECHVTRDAK